MVGLSLTTLNTVLITCLVTGVVTIFFTLALVLLVVIYQNTKNNRVAEEDIVTIPYGGYPNSGHGGGNSISFADLLRYSAMAQASKDKETPKAEHGGQYL